MQDDASLLRCYAEERSEAAFAELVRRHLNLVYYAALRQTGGDAALAEEVSQVVFGELARRATALTDRPVLAGWLFTSTRFAAHKARRSEARRRQREHAAHLMNELTQESVSTADWERLRPVIDDALHALEERDREAVLLRFFEGRAFAEVGARLAMTEDTARKRVERALEKMQAVLARQGVTSTSAALGVALAGQAALAAPAGLAASVTGLAMAGAAATTAGGWLMTFMAINKLPLAIIGALSAAGATTYVVQARTNENLRGEIVAMQSQQQQVTALRQENRQLASAAAEVDVLRQDDGELRRLEQRVTEVKQAQAESARVARAQAGNRSAALAAWVREQDRLAQIEVDGMNKVGNILVSNYKNLSERLKKDEATPVMNPDGRAYVEAMRQKIFGEIQEQQRKIQAYVEKTRQRLSPSEAEANWVAAGSPHVTETSGAEPNNRATFVPGGTLQLSKRSEEVQPSVPGAAGQFQFRADPPKPAAGP